ncbi:MAG: hypothetical protein LBF88_06940 [Planctomycetaceae bacterium]|jgi:hypothetical protein|nr:hypothetical protein [Planctomycetaceae bacterium]
MRIRRESFFATLVCFSLLFGVIGCRSNGGAWYNPKSYTWHNPFKSNEAPSFEAEGTAHATPKPSLGAQPNLTPPPGGYTSKEDEARFFAGNGKKESNSVVVPQYGVGTLSNDGNRLASANVPTTPTTSYAPMDHPYTGPQATPTHYQPTNYYYYADPSTRAIPSNQPGVYPGAGYQGSGLPENGAAPPDYQQPSYNTTQPSYNNTTPITPTPTPTTSYAAPNPQANYSPFGTQENTATTPTGSGYGAQPTTPTYSTQPVPPLTNNYGVPTATPPYNTDPATGFTVNPSNYNYQPTTQPAVY